MTGPDGQEPDGLQPGHPRGAQATGEIRNDDGLPTLRLEGYGVYEGDSGTTELQVDALLSHAPTADVAFTYETLDDTATAPSDHRATDGADNTSGFVSSPSFKVKVVQDGSRSIKSRGTWARKVAKGYFGGSVRQATKAGATQKLTAIGTDFAIVTTRGRDRGKATVLLDGKPVASLDLYARRTKTRQVVYSVSLPTAGKHTIALKATGKKRPAAKGTRVDLDAFVVLVP